MKKGYLIFFIVYLLLILGNNIHYVISEKKYFTTNDVCRGLFSDSTQIYHQYKTGKELICGGCFPIGQMLFPIFLKDHRESYFLQNEYEKLEELGLGYHPPLLDTINPYWKENALEIDFTEDVWKKFPIIRVDGNLDTFGVLHDKRFQINNRYHLSGERVKNAKEYIASISNDLPKLKPAKINGQKIPVEAGFGVFWRDSI